MTSYEKTLNFSRLVLSEAAGQDWREQIYAKSNSLKAASDPTEMAKLQKELQNLFDKFYAETWGATNINTVKLMGEAVRQELLTLGFSEDLNPFIHVIKKLLEKSLKLNAQQYGTIHNGFINGQLTKDELANLGENNNILFTEKNEPLLKLNFYQKDGGSRQRLLTCRNSALAWFRDQTADKAAAIKQINTIFYADADNGCTRLNPIESIVTGLSKLTGKAIDTDVNQKSTFKLDNNLAAVLAENSANAALAINSIIIKTGLDLGQVKKIITPQVYPKISEDFYKIGDAIQLSNFYNKYLNKYSITKSNAEAVIKSVLDTAFSQK